MNDRKRANGERCIHQWIIDVRGTEHEEAFNKELKELRERINGLSEFYKGKLGK